MIPRRKNVRIKNVELKNTSQSGGGGQTQNQAPFANSGIVLIDPAGETLLSGNIVTAPGSAFWMSASGDTTDGTSPSMLMIAENVWNGEFDADISGEARVEMIMDGNHIGGERGRASHRSDRPPHCHRQAACGRTEPTLRRRRNDGGSGAGGRS